MEVINIKIKSSNQFYFNFCILLILVYVFYGGYVRERMYYVGLGVFWESNPDKTIQDGYFTGLTVGNRLFAILEKKQLSTVPETKSPSKPSEGRFSKKQSIILKFEDITFNASSEKECSNLQLENVTLLS